MGYAIRPPENDLPSLFLAGGITGCPNWQQDLIDELKGVPVQIFNPRRSDFPMGDREAGRQQVEWEFRHLRRADFISFWFCNQTIQPIVLFELGAWSMVKADRLIVGAELGYERRFDVITQLQLIKPDAVISSSLSELTSRIKQQIEQWKPGL